MIIIKYSDDICRKVQQLGLLYPASNETLQWVHEQRSPLCILTQKLEGSVVPKYSVLDYLMYSQV